MNTDGILAEIRIEIVHENGNDVFMPTDILFEFATGAWEKRNWQPAKDPATGDVLKSAISGEPAILFRDIETEIPLTAEEMRRFCCHALRPEEYRLLRDAYGDIFDLHNDFYVPRTGEAIQSAI